MLKLRIIFPMALVLLLSFSVLPAAEKPVDYTTQIKPLFAKHCYSCHNVRKQESGLRLDAAKLAKQGGDRGAGIIPGNALKSPVYLALLGKGDISRMPAEKPPLSKADIALIKRWIDEGAKAPKNEVIATSQSAAKHWAFQPVKRPEIPSINSDWVQNPIDRFILARLTKEKLTPSPAANRTTLIRRLSLDLRGTPPSIEEVQQFLADKTPGAYERLVDRMLASPRFGERWGRHWLDVARYADSNGFTIDGPRSIWKYRDWVIQAMNHDLPFHQFVIEQLAGDLLPNPTRDQIIATGFHRNTLINQEGGTDQEQFRVDAVADRINTTGSAFLGLTVGCARCHEHKYDPLTQRDYYNMFAIFNNCDEPKIKVPTPQQTAELARLTAALKAAEKPLAEHDRKFFKGYPAWEKKLKQQAAAQSEDSFKITSPASLSSEKGTLLALQKDHSVFVDFSHPPNDTYLVEIKSPLKQVTAIRLEALTHPSLPKKGPGYAANGNFVLTGFELWQVAKTPGGKPVRLSLGGAIADHAQDGFPIENALDGKAKTGWAIGLRRGNANVNREAVFFLKTPLTIDPNTKLLVKLKHEMNRNYMIGRFRLSVSDAPRSALAIPASIRKILALPAKKRSKSQTQQLIAEFRKSDSARKPLAEKVTRLRTQKTQLEKAIPTTMVLKERKTPRQSHIHIRGDFLRKGARVTGGVPEFLPKLSSSGKYPNRKDFAQWLVDPRHPLTARVTVNRYWQRLFGKGIVQTENDFGTQGIPPTHPELLDWLASEFIRRNWSTKSFLKLLVTSATYRQSSEMRADLLKKDPANRLLARQSRLRLEAEVIRDVCLASSGLMSQKMLGPGVYPPQPKGIYVVTQQKKNWPESQGVDRHRRGLYTYFWRSSPYPFLPTFDAPDANTTCTRRSRSNTPLQALTLANDEAFVEIARGFSERVLKEASAYDDARLRFAFKAALSREPSATERKILTNFLNKQRQHFRANKKQAAAVSPKSLPKGVSEIDGAAWTAVTRVLLNLDEFITRE
ncbi:MAG: PSD1 and planctomycete cytochrome C domain-containing protein [Planctomycetaceae bacterium]